MAKQKDKQQQPEEKHPIITDKSYQFLKTYINNPSPLGLKAADKNVA